MPFPAWLQSGRPVCLAHRGGAGLWPENTLYAFRNAVRVGCDVIETDVHLTRDGELVLCHDDTVDRTTDGRGKVAELTCEELQHLDAAYRFEMGTSGMFPLRGKGVRVPTLREAVTALPGACFNVDIKASGKTGEVLASLIAELGLEERVVVASSHYSELKAFRERTQGRVATSASSREAVQFWAAQKLGVAASLRPPYQALQVPPSWGLLTLLTPRFMAAASALNLPVHFWTLNTKAEIDAALSAGAAGVVTDFPDLLLNVLETR